MRILTFTTLYPSAARPTHGIFVETRLRKLVERGAVSARVVAPCPWFPFASKKLGAYSAFAQTPLTETRHGIEIDHPRYPLLPKIGMSTAPLVIFAAVLPHLRRQIRDGRDFDLIDAHYFYPDGAAVVLLGRKLGRPVVITARGDDLDLISNYAVPRRWIRSAARHAVGLITVSNGLKRRLEALGIASDRIKMLRNGVDPTVFRPCDRVEARRALGFVRPTLLAVGNMVQKKRHALLVEVLAQLEGIDLAIIGDGPERTRIEALANRLGVAKRLRLLGRIPQERLPQFYAAADLLVHPSSREGWPNVLLESMACGTAVVATYFDGLPDIIAAPEAGRIVTRATPTGLADVIREVLAAPPKREATRLYAEGFDWQATTAGQIELFRDICYPGETAVPASSPAGEPGDRGVDATFVIQP